MSGVMVTGATGFVGSPVVRHLLLAGYEVIAVGRTAPDPQKGLSFIKANILDAKSRRRAVKIAKADRLVHLAWIAMPGVYWRSPENLDWVAASLDLIKHFREHGGGRAVAVGTCAEYEWGALRVDEETTPCRPSTLYGVSKDATRRILLAFAEEVGLSLAWARLFFMYGPGERSGRLVSDAIVALREGRAFPTSDGTQRRSYMHVADTARALVALLKSDVNGAIDIASGRAVAVREILEEIARSTGNRDCLRFGEIARSSSDPEIIEASGRRLAEEVGFQPIFDLRTGLEDTLAKSTIGGI